jgi:hypothetical protein
MRATRVGRLGCHAVLVSKQCDCSSPGGEDFRWLKLRSEGVSQKKNLEEWRHMEGVRFMDRSHLLGCRFQDLRVESL